MYIDVFMYWYLYNCVSDVVHSEHCIALEKTTVKQQTLNIEICDILTIGDTPSQGFQEDQTFCKF